MPSGHGNAKRASSLCRVSALLLSLERSDGRRCCVSVLKYSNGTAFCPIVFVCFCDGIVSIFSSEGETWKPMAVDVLQEVFNSFRLRTLIADSRLLAAPWGFRVIPGDRENEIVFLVMIEGSALLELEEADPLARQLQSGDIVVVPRSETYVLRDNKHSPIWSLSELQERAHDVGGPTTHFVGGCYRLADGARNLFFPVLPRIIHLRPQDYQSRPELQALMRLFREEATQASVSQSAVLTRLTEVLFLHILRTFTLHPQEEISGWLRGLADPSIATALQAIHANPAEQWSVERLAIEAHMSRAVFAARFRELVGESPMQYVQRWRMQRAANLLEAGHLSQADIIALSGYSSEGAFRSAFQRWIGVLPSQYKRGIRRSGEKKTEEASQRSFSL
jgi:AraC-like DNA-binding protein